VVDLIKLREIVGDRIIISDNCDGFGGTLNGKFIDSYADVSCVSFHAAHIITTGEGGAILSSNEDILTRARKMREWGRASGTDKITQHEGMPQDYKERYVFEEIGYNLKPLELQCAMGRIQLKRLQGFKDARTKNFEKLFDIFARLTECDLVIESEGANPCWFSFPFFCTDKPRMQVMDWFEKNGIECRTIFSGNILRHPAYKNEPHIKIGDLENSDTVMFNGMFISTHPSITQEQMDYVEKVVSEL
jgi:CDP-6-deoxy-D-xylo-4-hexulose-3-dehydrase